MSEKSAPKTRVFLSYDFKTHKQLAAELTAALYDRNFRVWQDQGQRRNLRRIIQAWRHPAGEWGLDSWLRKGILQSEIVVALVPYDRQPDYFPDSWSPDRPSTPQELLNILSGEINDLRGSYRGKASSKWTDPHQLDQAGYYLFRPIQTFRMAWYEKHAGRPLGKDPFEHWRRWEMRVAGAAALPVILVFLIELQEDRFADFVTEQMAEHPTYIVVRRSALQSDLQSRLLPAIERARPSVEEAGEIRECKHKLRRLRIRARLVILLCVGLAIGLGILAFRVIELLVYAVGRLQI